MKSKTRSYNSWVLAAFYLGGLIWVTGLYKCTMDEVAATQEMTLVLSQQVVGQSAMNRDIYADILDNRVRLSVIKNDLVIVKKIWGLDGYHIQLVPILVPGSILKQKLPEGWTHDYTRTRSGP